MESIIGRTKVRNAQNSFLPNDVALFYSWHELGAIDISCVFMVKILDPGGYSASCPNSVLSDFMLAACNHPGGRTYTTEIGKHGKSGLGGLFCGSSKLKEVMEKC